MGASAKINQCIGVGAALVPTFPVPFIAQRAPVDGVDVNFPLGMVWIDNSVNPAVVYTYVDSANGIWDTGGNAEATTSSFGIVQLATLAELQGGSAPAGAYVPTANDVATVIAGIVVGAVPAATEAIAGIAEIATQAETNAGLDDTRIVTPLKLAGALVAGLTITAGAGSFTTLAASGLASLSGSATITTGATALNLASDAGAGAVNIGTGAAARVITIGNSTGATSIALSSGTGAINIGTNAVAHTITLGNSTGATSLVLDSGTGPINIGTNAIAHTINLGNITGATAVNINAGSGGSTITTTNSTLALLSGTGAINIGTDAAAHTITIGNATGATSLILNSGTGAINIGTNAVAHTITIGNITGATAVNINSGTGANTWTTTNGAWSLVTGTGAINIGADAVAKTITIGNATGATGVSIIGGSNNVAVTSAHLKIATTGKGLQIKSGAVTDFAGTAVLTLGTVTIANTNIATGDLIFLSRVSANASVTLGILSYTIINGTSFTINSLILGTPASVQTADVSSVAYFIVRPL